MSHLALSGLRALELGGYLASPFAGNLLAHLGAEVIKIEPPSGDPTRTMIRGGPGGTFIAYSQGKKSLCIDLRTEAGQKILKRLIATADIVLHNLSREAAQRLNLTAAACHRINPRLVHCHITGYGPGPRENELASNPIVEAATGVIHAHRVDGRPTRTGPSYLDMFAGMNAVIGIAASFAAKETRENRFIEVGLYETGLHVAARDLVAVQLDQHVAAQPDAAKATEFHHPGYGAYRTADDKWIYLLLLSDAHWMRFCRVMGVTAGEGGRLDTLRQRLKHAPEVESIVSSAVGARSYAEMAKLLDEAGIGFTEVKAPAKVLDDPQARQPGKIVQFAFGGHPYEVPAFPMLSDGPTRPLDPPPRLGQHTREILAALGYGDAECAALLQERVVVAS